jgi:hypothetical protein
MQRLLEDFGQEPAPIRILLASDMASEGLNLHFQCRRLIHFDLPWSLIRFQQRNGRIDRYGQDRQPLITYFVGESSHPQVRDMWVLDRLVAKDEAAQAGVGDPAVFLRRGDADGEEEAVAEVIEEGIGGDAFEALMDENAARASGEEAIDPFEALMLGEYDDDGLVQVERPEASAFDDVPTLPRIFDSTFSFTSAALQRLARDDIRLLDKTPGVYYGRRVIDFPLPAAMPPAMSTIASCPGKLCTATGSR